MVVEINRIRAPRDVDPVAVAPALSAVPLDASTLVGQAVAYTARFTMRTRGVAPSFFDVTDLVAGAVQQSGVQIGQALAATEHTTCALIVQENEPLLLADLADRLRRFADQDESYRHNDLDVRVVNVCGPEECANGHSHCQHALLGASVVVPVQGGQPTLGRWQRVLLVELDHPRQRELSIQVVGIGHTAPDGSSHRAFPPLPFTPGP